MPPGAAALLGARIRQVCALLAPCRPGASAISVRHRIDDRDHLAEEIDMNAPSPTNGLNLLWCDTACEVDVSASEEAWASSPVRCLAVAMEQRPRIIVVRFGNGSLRERAALVELCATIKRHRLTRASTVVALLGNRHRALMESLKQAGVDYIRPVDRLHADSGGMRPILGGLGLEDRPRSLLAAMCPWLHYRPIDSRRELTVCGAYRDRMVLGASCLRDVCHGANHLICEYFLDPRSAT
jgi:hypothetical protein